MRFRVAKGSMQVNLERALLYFWTVGLCCPVFTFLNPFVVYYFRQWYGATHSLNFSEWIEGGVMRTVEDHTIRLVCALQLGACFLGLPLVTLILISHRIDAVPSVVASITSLCAVALAGHSVSALSCSLFLHVLRRGHLQEQVVPTPQIAHTVASAVEIHEPVEGHEVLTTHERVTQDHIWSSVVNAAYEQGLRDGLRSFTLLGPRVPTRGPPSSTLMDLQGRNDALMRL